MLKHVGSNTTRRVISLMVNRFEKPLEDLWKSGLDLSSRNVQRNYLGVNKQFYIPIVTVKIKLGVGPKCYTVKLMFILFFINKML